jgi:hypothetical protein
MSGEKNATHENTAEHTLLWMFLWCLSLSELGFYIAYEIQHIFSPRSM